MKQILTHLLVSTAVLAVSRASPADIPRRELSSQVPVSLKLADGGDPRCTVSAWSGVGLEGSCGSYGWEQLTGGGAFGALKAVVPAQDRDATRDALAVVLSLPDAASVGALAVDWARRRGLDDAAISAARQEADLLRKARDAALREREESRALRASPEAGNFPQVEWKAPTTAAFADASTRVLEAARALLARAGGSGTLHETDHIAVLAESDDPSFVTEAAALEKAFVDWSARFAAAGVETRPQARVAVIFTADRDRWRQLVVSAFGGDPDAHPDGVTVYLPVGAQPSASFLAPVVIVPPGGDRLRVRYGATLGLARAVLHYTGAPARGPAFLNEGLPRVMAEIAVPKAGVDASVRRRVLPEIRSGAKFDPILKGGYGEAAWKNDPRRSGEFAYVFVRWLWDNEPDRLVRFAEASGVWGLAGTDTAEVRFRKVFGSQLDAASAKAADWFMRND